MDFLDFQTEPWSDKVRLMDGVHSRFDIGYPFDQNPEDNPFCDPDYYYYDDYIDNYDYRDGEEESQKVERPRQKKRNQPNKKKLEEMGNNNSNPKNIKRRPHIKKEVNKQGNSNKKIKQDVQRNLKKKKNRTNTNKKGSPARKPNGKPNGKPNVKPTRKPNGKPSDKPNGNKANGSRQPGFPGFDPNQIIAVGYI